jgi:WhiB family transcriptional regulator, redox-sensing transcriptional regulator
MPATRRTITNLRLLNPVASLFSTARWRLDAACRDHDPALFDPVEAGETRAHITNRLAIALAVCADCPVRAECRTEADDLGDLGVRGGVLLVRAPDTRKASKPAVDDSDLAGCGTYAAWRRHLRRGEDVDDACRKARAAYVARRRRANRAAESA